VVVLWWDKCAPDRDPHCVCTHIRELTVAASR